MWMAHAVACHSLPLYSSRFSRRDFTLPQLFACLAIKEMLKRSYRGAEALLKDSTDWLSDIGMDHAPDHNTLWRAAKFLLGELKADGVLDVATRWADEAGMLQLDQHPLAIDSTTFDSHHVSRHYERRCRDTQQPSKSKDGKKDGKSRRSTTARGLPKLAIGICTQSHFIASMWTGTGIGADQPHFESLVCDAQRRVRRKRFKVVGDAGYDGEPIHKLAREKMGLTTLIPPNGGRPRKDGGPPGGRWRRVMKKLLGTSKARRRHQYTSRWQVETGNSMMKRNQGSALSGKPPESRNRDMRLRVLTHDMMIL
jgi:Transposase DDE domain